MPSRHYSSTAQPALLAADPGLAGVTLSLSAAPAGWPTSFPFTVALERGVPGQEELALVTAMPTSTTATVVRGYDGTTAKTHPVSAKAEHVTAAVDFTEAQARLDALERDTHITRALFGGPT